MRLALVLSALLFSSSVWAAPALPYDETANARDQIEHALAEARSAHTPVLLIFGANWCEDCRALSKAMNTPENAALIGKEFRVVKVDVGHFDHNVDLAAAYGNPIKKGIPAAVVVTPDNEVLYATRGGELADARRISDSGIYDFFDRVAHPK